MCKRVDRWARVGRIAVPIQAALGTLSILVKAVDTLGSFNWPAGFVWGAVAFGVVLVSVAFVTWRLNKVGEELGRLIQDFRAHSQKIDGEFEDLRKKTASSEDLKIVENSIPHVAAREVERLRRDHNERLDRLNKQLQKLDKSVRELSDNRQQNP